MKIEELLSEIESLFKEVKSKEEWDCLYNIVDDWANDFQTGGVISDIAEKRGYIDNTSYII